MEQKEWARLIVCSFCEAIPRHIAVSRQGSARRKDAQKMYFAAAACICKAFLKRSDGEINPCKANRPVPDPCQA